MSSESLCRWDTSVGLARHTNCNVFEISAAFVIIPGASPLRRAIVVVIGEKKDFLTAQSGKCLEESEE